MFHQKLLKVACFVPLLAFCRQNNKKRPLLHRMESLQMFNFIFNFTLLAYYAFWQCLWYFINSYGIFMMFSINFESDLVLFHSRATSVFQFINI